MEAGKNVFGELTPVEIRVSHQINGRVPTALHKKASELTDEEKTVYYQRMAFVCHVAALSRTVNGHQVYLCIGGVRAYNEDKLYGRQTTMKFKIFVGWQVRVCSNLCLTCDGFTGNLECMTTSDIKEKALSYLPKEMREVVDKFYDKVGYHPDREIDFTQFMEDCINWIMPGLQFFYRDTNSIDNPAEVYHVGETIRAGFFIDVTTKLLKPVHKTRFIIASSHVAPLYEIEDLVKRNPKLAEWNLCTLHYNSYFKVLDIYKKENVTQVLLLHIPENMARLMNGLSGIQFIDQAMGENRSLVDIARSSLDQKMLMEVHPRSLDKEWCDRMDAPVGLTDECELFPLEPMPDYINQEAATFGHAVHKMANDSDVEITWKKKGV